MKVSLAQHCSGEYCGTFAENLINPSLNFAGPGFHRSDSSTSLNSVLGIDGDLHIRTCINCRTLLERRDQQIEQRSTKPTLVLLYEVCTAQ